MAQPRFLDDQAFRCLRMGDAEGFSRQVAGRTEIDFSDTDLRGVDLRGVDLSKLVIRGAYLRDADVRGLDLRHMDLEGCSLYHAKISGTYFPPNLTPQEITASVQLGTRMRTKG
jgi:uncharacterized protein YjbI with pentapeptide repeats